MSEYGAWCGDLDTTLGGGTWGEVRQEDEEALDQYESVSPPDVLQEVYEANKEILMTVLVTAEKQDRDGPVHRSGFNRDEVVGAESSLAVGIRTVVGSPNQSSVNPSLRDDLAQKA